MGVFRFKQFSVDDTHASLKVGTDAVLLGAWCEVTGAKRLLDIGTGSGVIALMLAQRTDARAHIDAVEVNPTDASQAKVNVLGSPWPRKVEVWQGPIQAFASDDPYDHIVCNPPYFTGSLLPPDPGRTRARHDTHMTLAALLDAVERLLHRTGTFSLILPPLTADEFIKMCASRSLFLCRSTLFFTRPGKPAARYLLSFTRNREPVLESKLILYENGNQPSDAYRRLTGDFYL